ncbi:MAG: pyruvate kinase [Actinomycetota bacterium]|nr:pyruvate kinase [Actinomycetota bacterium]
MRRTKIVATIGPASRDPEVLRAMVRAGMDVARLNFAHGEPAEHAETARRVREAALAEGRTVGILADLPGPKMRTGAFATESVELATGATFTLASQQVPGDAERVSTTVDDLPGVVSVGDEVYLADGEVVLRVTGIEGGDVATEVVRGGRVRSRKGLHLPAAELRLEAFTEDDRRALDIALEMEVDLVGLSFIRDERDLAKARAALPGNAIRPHLVAKIETASAVENLNAVVAAADAVMVARGDLGIQTPLERVPLLQKQIIRACNRIGKPVITATEMLESMTEEPLPSRAEVTDVANAVFDGTDALMLSEETAVGRYPIEAVETMAKVAESAETRRRRKNIELGLGAGDEDRVAWAVAHAAVEAAEDLGAAAILSVTRAGSTPRRVAAYRPGRPVGALSPSDDCLGPLALVWGVQPLQVPELPSDTEVRSFADQVVRLAAETGFVGPGDLVVVVAGSPGIRAGATDFMRVVRA